MGDGDSRCAAAVTEEEGEVAEEEGEVARDREGGVGGWGCREGGRAGW